MKTLIAASLLGATALGGIAYAAVQTTPPASKPMKGDANGDGSVTRAEFMANAQAKFATLDADENGAISAAEAPRGKAKRNGRRGGMGGPFDAAGQDGAPPAGAMGRGRGMARLDTDSDGKLSRAEFDAQSGQRFARLDTNGDGSIDKTEMAAGPGGGRGLARVDADGNGTVTKAEMDAQSGQRFARLDGNGDGFVDAAEQAAMAQGMRGGRNRGAAPPMPTPAPAPSPAPPSA